ncbi:MAG: Smr/MutS family protein [Eikenella sp.]|nr:Smr/MutS family protein [Eikenella sp.]
MRQSFQDVLKQLGKQAEQARAAEAERLAEERKARAEEVDFAAAVGAVVPLKSSNRAVLPRDTSPIRRRAPEEEALEEADYFYVGDQSRDEPPRVFGKNGRGGDDIRRLLGGYWPVVAKLDLHGYRQESAQQVLNEFVAYVQKRGVCAEIVHGSGLGSRGFTPVLKTLVRRWLMEHPEVLAYAEPHRHNDGAVRILLRKSRRAG